MEKYLPPEEEKELTEEEQGVDPTTVTGQHAENCENYDAMTGDLEDE